MFRRIARQFILAIFFMCLMQASYVWAKISDPTRPAFLQTKKTPIKKRKPAKPLVLTSIIVSPHRRVAIINNKVVAVGEKVANAIVVSIESNYVSLKRRNKLITVRFNKIDNVKQQHKPSVVSIKYPGTEKDGEN